MRSLVALWIPFRNTYCAWFLADLMCRLPRRCLNCLSGILWLLYGRPFSAILYTRGKPSTSFNCWPNLNLSRSFRIRASQMIWWQPLFKLGIFLSQTIQQPQCGQSDTSVWSRVYFLRHLPAMRLMIVNLVPMTIPYFPPGLRHRKPDIQGYTRL